MGEFVLQLGDRSMVLPNTWHTEGALVLWKRCFGTLSDDWVFSLGLSAENVPRTRWQWPCAAGDPDDIDPADLTRPDALAVAATETEQTDAEGGCVDASHSRAVRYARQETTFTVSECACAAQITSDTAMFTNRAQWEAQGNPMKNDSGHWIGEEFWEPAHGFPWSRPILFPGTVGNVLGVRDSTAFISSDWDDSTKTLREFYDEAYGGIDVRAGDTAVVDGGTGVTAGEYTVASKVDGYAITLSDDITSGGDVTDHSVHGHVLTNWTPQWTAAQFRKVGTDAVFDHIDAGASLDGAYDWGDLVDMDIYAVVRGDEDKWTEFAGTVTAANEENGITADFGALDFADMQEGVCRISVRPTDGTYAEIDAEPWKMLSLPVGCVFLVATIGATSYLIASAVLPDILRLAPGATLEVTYRGMLKNLVTTSKFCQRFVVAAAERMFIGRAEYAWSEFEFGLGTATANSLTELSGLADVNELTAEGYARVAGTWIADTEDPFALLTASSGWGNTSEESWPAAKCMFVTGTLGATEDQLCMVLPVPDADQVMDPDDTMVLAAGSIPFTWFGRQAGTGGL